MINKKVTLGKRKRKKRRKSQKMKKNYAYNKNKNYSVKESMKNSVDCKKKQKRKSNDYNSLR